MPIKKLMCRSEIADSPFRSLQEVENYLKTIKQKMDEAEALLRKYQSQFSHTERAASLTFEITRDPTALKRKKDGLAPKIDKIVIPSLDKLRANFGIVDELAEQVENMETLYSSVLVSFKGSRGQQETLKSIKAMKSAAEAKLKRALEFLGTIGDKYAPTDFKKLVADAIDGISEGLTFRSHRLSYYANEETDGTLVFTAYLELIDLAEQNDGEYPSFYVVFTCRLSVDPEDKKSLTVKYLATVMHHFQAPGKFFAGKPVTNAADAVTKISTMLALENIATTIGSIPHNLNPDKITKDRFRVKDKIARINVEPNSLTFAFLKSVKEKEARVMSNSLYVEVQQILHHIKGARVKVRFGPGTGEDAGRMTVRFTLTNPAQDTQVSTDDIDFLKNQFKLDDSRLRQVVKIINS
jgi:hypothetical protein